MRTSVCLGFGIPDHSMLQSSIFNLQSWIFNLQSQHPGWFRDQPGIWKDGAWKLIWSTFVMLKWGENLDGIPLQPNNVFPTAFCLSLFSQRRTWLLMRWSIVQVLREVAVLDTINPGGFYAAKVRQLANFAAASTHFTSKRAPWAFGDGIEDPLYGNVGGHEEEGSLWRTLRKLRLSCAGLAQFLVELQSRYWYYHKLEMFFLNKILVTCYWASLSLRKAFD